jgi:hypothetical protein
MVQVEVVGVHFHRDVQVGEEQVEEDKNEEHTCNATVAKTHHLVRGSARINSLISGYFLRISILREACGSSCTRNRSLHQHVKLG